MVAHRVQPPAGISTDIVPTDQGIYRMLANSNDSGQGNSQRLTVRNGPQSLRYMQRQGISGNCTILYTVHGGPVIRCVAETPAQ
jgi:hypothetical protein